MGKKQIFMFSGQGSQYYQMGKELYQNHQLFKQSMDECNAFVAPLIGMSLTEVIYNPKVEKGAIFDRLLYTNPALLSIQYSLVRVLKDMGVYPDFVMGYSLGEVTAAIVSEAISLEDGLKLVVDMAHLAEEETPQARMLAIMAEKIIVVQNPDLFSKCWLTATNFTENFVISGLPHDIQSLQNDLKEEGITTQKLPVNYGFHTPLIEGLEHRFKKILSEISYSGPVIPIISSRQNEVVASLTDEYFWEVIRYPVNFQKTIENTVKNEDFVFIDLGPSGSLATSIKYILPPSSNSVALQVMNQYGKNLHMLEKFGDNLLVNS